MLYLYILVVYTYFLFISGVANVIGQCVMKNVKNQVYIGKRMDKQNQSFFSLGGLSKINQLSTKTG